MARKLSDAEVKAYNDLVDAGHHLEARQYLANTISPSFMIIARRETSATQKATTAPEALNPETTNPSKDKASATPAREVKAQAAQSRQVQPRNIWERHVPKSKPELSETSADPSSLVISSPVQPGTAKSEKVAKRQKSIEPKQPAKYTPKSCRPCFKGLTRRPKQK